MAPKDELNRREFLVPAAAGAAFTLVPRHVLGGSGYVAPSDKLVMAHIGCGTEGHHELLGGLIQDPQVQIVAVCDPVKDSTAYRDWGKNGIRDSVRRLLGDSSWGEGLDGVRCGRDPFQQIVQRYYAKTRGAESYKVSSYADFRELLEKEKDIDCVKIMTPDHLHATIAVAAMKKGKNVLLHKPLSNRMHEVRLVIDTARKTKVATHFLGYVTGLPSPDIAKRIVALIKEGAIGPLREVHNWTNRPVWPQFTELPADRPPIPEGFDWNLWLGPSLDRPYHPNYTHMVFRGWYEFGAGSIADMGIYSLWPVFTALNLGPPLSVRTWATHTCNFVDSAANTVVNDFSFPTACVLQFQYAARPDMPALDVFWYEGGMLPRIPEVDSEEAAVAPEGFLYVGDKGKILVTGTLASGEAPRLITAKGSEPLWREVTPTPSSGPESLWVPSFKGGDPSPGSFLNAGPISETVCLAAVGLRAGRQKGVGLGSRDYPAPVKLLYDSANMKITNAPEANKFLTREYRPGWEL